MVLEEEVENKTDVSFWLSAAISKTLSFFGRVSNWSVLFDRTVDEAILLEEVPSNRTNYY